MNRSKRQQHPTRSDVAHNQIKKSKRTIASTAPTINIFEDLANEVIHEIFDYLDAYHIYQGFYKLNARFQNLLSYANAPIKINISSFSKSQFQHYYTDFIKPNQHRIKTLHLSDPITVEQIFPMVENICIYSQLQTLHLENIESRYMDDLLDRLVLLPSLSSLTLRVGRGLGSVNIYDRLFQLPALKFCELLDAKYVLSEAIQMSVNTLSPLQHLIINNGYDLNTIDALLSYFPHLRCLSIIGHDASVLVFVLLNNLTQWSFTLYHIHSCDLEQFLKKNYNQIKLLHFGIIGTQVDPHTELWKKTILSYLPHMKTVHFEHAKEILCDYTLERYTPLFSGHLCYQKTIKQWFFTHESMSEEMLYRTFCSLKPPRKRHYTIDKELAWNQPICQVKNMRRSIRHLIIENETEIENCPKSFPNVTELTLDTYQGNCFTLFASDSLRRMISLTHLKKITIKGHYLTCNGLVYMLLDTPNLHTLIISYLHMGTEAMSLLQGSENFHFLSKQNKIKHIDIKNYSLRATKTLIKICPELQHLTLGTSQQPFEAVVRFLLFETRKNSCPVSSLSFHTFEVNEPFIARVKNIVESKKHCNDYSMKVLDNILHLWW